MSKKLEQNELENVTGGACGTKHVLHDRKVDVGYYLPNGDFDHQVIIVQIYEDTGCDDNGRSTNDLAMAWCREHGYKFCGWEDAK